jgi:nitrate reductase delta subunit
MMGVFAILAEAFRYPAPGRLDLLHMETCVLPPGPVRDRLETFVRQAGRLGLPEWEELYTSTLDLNPAVPLYVGYAIWGDNYARARFMVNLNQAMRGAGVDLDGELPDHLVPVLRYLDSVACPLAELDAVLEPALASMHQTMARARPDNLYLGLLAATRDALAFKQEGV